MLVGLGITRSFINNSAEERFGQLERVWKKQLGSAMIDNPFETPGTGPLLFGVFLLIHTVLKKNFGSHLEMPCFICLSLC